MIYQVTIDLRVLDEETLFRQALYHAITVDDMSEDEARALLRPDDDIDTTACLIMVLDPGKLPGCEIFETSADSVE